MNFKLFVLSAAVLAAMTACGEDDPKPEIEPPTVENLSGEVSGVWEKNSVIKVSGHITVPEGESLVIEEGVQVIFDSNGVGATHTPIEFIVDGNLYCRGTEANPILLSVDESERTEANAMAGLWGGIVATETCEEVLFDHAIIEYTGGLVMQDSPSAVRGIYTPGDDLGPQFTSVNVDGRYVIVNSTLRYGASDAVYLMGGSAIIKDNIFAGNGADGGEAVNVKAGCKVDVSGNIMYSPNTNGLKLSSSGQNDEGGRTQAEVRAYNNTIINAGWRRDGTKGGGIYVEKNALVSVFNNLIVNCKFKAMTPSWEMPNDPEEGMASASVIDYNFYVSGSAESTLDQDIENGTTTSYLGYTLPNDKISPSIDLHSIVSASAGDDATDPLFVNFPYDTNPLTSFVYDDAWDFHVQAGSPVLSGAYAGSDSNMQPFFLGGLSVGGTTYVSSAPQAHFGAFGE